MHIGQFVLSWTANLSFSRDEQIQRSHYHAAIREQVAAKPDATLAELRTWLAQTHQVSVSVTLMWETLAQLRLTLKKRPCTRRNRTARMSPRLASPGAKASLR
jgi:transposase